jgi:hypothetical protein
MSLLTLEDRPRPLASLSWPWYGLEMLIGTVIMAPTSHATCAHSGTTLVLFHTVWDLLQSCPFLDTTHESSDLFL